MLLAIEKSHSLNIDKTGHTALSHDRHIHRSSSVSLQLFRHKEKCHWWCFRIWIKSQTLQLTRVTRVVNMSISMWVCLWVWEWGSQIVIFMTMSKAWYIQGWRCSQNEYWLFWPGPSFPLKQIVWYYISVMKQFIHIHL